jgi:AcrR family transcriptional regulator
LRDAIRVLLRERPLLHGRQLLAEEGVRGGDRLLEGASDSLVDRRPVVGSEDAPGPDVDGTRLVAARAVKLPRRKYHSPLRADQAEQTRRRVLEAAFRLFVDRGYAATTIAAVAEQAGVSPETVYLSVGGKRGLLEGVIEMAIAGENDPPAQEDSWWATVAGLPGASERLEKIVAYSCRILARTYPIHAVIRGAADKEPFAAALGRRLLHDRLTNQTERVRQYLDDDLRQGLSVEEAGQRYCALTSPELYYLLTVEFGWPAAEHKKWLTELLETELLGPDPARPSMSVARRQRRGHLGS